MIENIPAELRALPQWVAAGSDKIPINPRTGQRADPANPATGGTFAEAIQAGMRHIGFILGKSDPYTIVDLDDPYERNIKGVKTTISATDPDYQEAVERAARHTKIYESFDTYAELSQSGHGAHLVMRGNIPCGVRRDKVEIYSCDRYMIFTGNVLKAAPVSDCQELLNGMFAQMGKLTDEAGELIEEEPTLGDHQIWEMAGRASNGEKFTRLCDGDWNEMGYPSQSEADYALISMLAFYSRANEQVRRMFRLTALGQRAKATRNDVYINRSLRRIRARECPLVDISQLPQVERPATPEVSVMPIVEKPNEVDLQALPKVGGSVTPGYTFPPGLVGKIAEYVLSSAIRPIPEVALAAALALCAGVCARSYNISGTGLNQYIILLAKTGRGKEGASTGIDNLIAAVRQNIPMADQFIGPAAFASGQALVKVLDSKPCFMSVLGEFGLTLQQICDPQAPAATIMLKRVLLDIYAKSGFTKVLRSSVYSDSEKNTHLVQAPNVTVLGESTPETFFNGLDTSHISEGLIPRFTVIEYHGARPPQNKKAFHPPTPELVQAFGELVTVAVNTAQNHSCMPVSMTTDAQVIFDAINDEADARINKTALDVEAELWNRAHLKALKMAALVAVGAGMHAPNITAPIAEWACALVRREIGDIMLRFSSGDVGTGEAKQEHEVRRLFSHFQTLTPEQRKAHRCPQGLMDAQVCPAGFLTIYARRLSCFKSDRRGSTKAINDCLADMVKREVFEMVPLQQLQAEYQMRTAIYYPGKGW